MEKMPIIARGGRFVGRYMCRLGLYGVGQKWGGNRRLRWSFLQLVFGCVKIGIEGPMEGLEVSVKLVLYLYNMIIKVKQLLYICSREPRTCWYDCYCNCDFEFLY